MLVWLNMKNRSGSSSKERVQRGIIKRHPDGFGFFIPDTSDDPDVYIPRKKMKGVMSNDRVEVSVRPEPGGDRFRGEILQVLERSMHRVTGQYYRLSDETGILRDKSFGWGEDIIVDHPYQHEVKDGDWVSVVILTYPGSEEGFTGRVDAVIGDALDPLNDAKRVLYSHSIPHEFSDKTLKQVEALPDEVEPKDFDNRRDLRDINLITIDGKTAKDFDDAIFVEPNEEGFRLVVAIADVSHYVKPGSAVDEDAYVRGTSTYFPNFVSPMLPEQLSNHLCSLRPNVARLAFVCDMQLDFQGDLKSSEFYEAVIESKARVTYGEAEEVIDGSTPESIEHVEAEIKHAADLAKILMAKRFREGSLDLEIPETEIEVDEAGEPVDIMQAERLFAHKLIEEMMLMANVAVAEFFTRREVPAMYRIHEAPDKDAIELLESFLVSLGAKKGLSGGKLQKKISRSLQGFSGHPKEHILHILTLRSMSQAKYSPHNVGHFGLGFEDYSHFTSPIRRYPDLIVHRTLKALVLPAKGYRLMSMDELESAGTFLSACEQRSVKAERQINAIKKARFIQRYLGEELEGTISSVTKFGIFVILRRFSIDGLIRVEDLGGERFEFDEQNLKLVAKKSGMTYSIGDPVTVQVARADIDQGQIDFVLAGEQPIVSNEQKERKPPKERGKTKKDRRGVRKARVSKSRRKS